MTDGHVQYNGTSFQFYKEKQPGFSCSTKDCSECKAKSAQYDSMMELAAKTEADKKAAADKAQADADGAAQAVKDADAAQTALTTLKNQKIHAIQMAYEQNIGQAKTDHLNAIAKFKADCEAAIRAENDRFTAIDAAAMTQMQKDCEAVRNSSLADLQK